MSFSRIAKKKSKFDLKKNLILIYLAFLIVIDKIIPLETSHRIKMIKYNIGDFITFMVDEFVTNMQSHTFKQFRKIQCKNRKLLN